MSKKEMQGNIKSGNKINFIQKGIRDESKA